MASKRGREKSVKGEEKEGKVHKKAEKPSKKNSASQEVAAPDAGAQDEIILVNSDTDNSGESDGVVVVSEDEEEGAPPAKRARVEPDSKASVNEVTGNNDFIGFGFETSDEEADEEESSHNLFPWVKGQNHSEQKEIADWLTLEIKDFVNYISPSKEEILMRNKVISRLKEHISSFWPDTQAHVFGSSATDLYLPGSDIDMVVVSDMGNYGQRQRLYQLSSYLRTHKLAKNIEVIAHTKVPIIKFVDPDHNIHVDISFERTNGIEAARRIRGWLDSTPGLRELVLIIKQFLRSRKLNNVHMGGLGGYATIILVYHFLWLHPRISSRNIHALENLGTLLIEFFELYGRNFSYDNLVIALDHQDMPKYLVKRPNWPLCGGRGSFNIVIQDPSDPSNNITRSSYNLRDLKKAFNGAYQLLTAKCFELHSASYKERIGQSILGDIITFSGDSRDFNDERSLVANSALISQDAEVDNNSADESDGANGNDKYYLSDMSEEAVVPAPKTKSSKRKQAKKERKLKGRALKKEEEQLREAREEKESKNGQPPKKKVSDYLSLDVESDDSSKNDSSKNDSSKTSKRDYWNMKGLEAAT